ncbi:MAG: sugar phosphate nucleotidyltransferase [Nannocystaceae bacterium]
MPERFVLVMAGGSGSRLWPASTDARPKHLLGLSPGAPTLLDATIERARQWIDPARIWVITTAAQRPAIVAAHPELVAAQILAEPCGRNTAPAIAFALLHIRDHLERRGLAAEDAIVAALPADHHVAAPERLLAALIRASEHAERAQVIVTLGIEPRRPATGYGYIERAEGPRPAAADEAPIFPVVRFVEKPNAKRAARFLASGRFLWNAGIFVLPLARTLAAFSAHAPAIADALAPVAEALRGGDPQAIDAAATAAYAAVPSQPIDIAVIEELAELDVLPVSLGWNDLGSWAAIHSVSPTDERGNALLAGDDAAVDAIDCDRNLIWSEGQEVIAIGVRDLAVIASGGKVLICPLDRAQEVREAARRSAARARADD